MSDNNYYTVYPTNSLELGKPQHFSIRSTGMGTVPYFWTSPIFGQMLFMAKLVGGYAGYIYIWMRKKLILQLGLHIVVNTVDKYPKSHFDLFCW